MSERERETERERKREGGRERVSVRERQTPLRQLLHAFSEISQSRHHLCQTKKDEKTQALVL